MSTYGALLEDSRTNMVIIQWVMVVTLISSILITFVMLVDDQIFIGTGGAYICSALPIGYIVF